MKTFYEFIVEAAQKILECVKMHYGTHTSSSNKNEDILL
jgi:hypothetical protein